MNVARYRRARTPHDDLKQQAGRVLVLGHEDIGHEGAHDGARELLPRFHRDNPAHRPPASDGERLPGLRLGKAGQLAVRAAATIVEAAVAGDGACSSRSGRRPGRPGT
jgi:hypothetical protein